MQFEQPKCPDCGGDPKYMQINVPTLCYLSRDAKGEYQTDDTKPMLDYAFTDTEGVSDLICSKCLTEWRTRNGDGEGKLLNYRVQAHHTRLGSIGHRCEHGVFDDPADNLDAIVLATSVQDAVDEGHKEMRELLGKLQACPCGRYPLPEFDTSSWWDDLHFSAWLTTKP